MHECTTDENVIILAANFHDPSEKKSYSYLRFSLLVYDCATLLTCMSSLHPLFLKKTCMVRSSRSNNFIGTSMKWFIFSPRHANWHTGMTCQRIGYNFSVICFWIVIKSLNVEEFLGRGANIISNQIGIRIVLMGAYVF